MCVKTTPCRPHMIRLSNLDKLSKYWGHLSLYFDNVLCLVVSVSVGYFYRPFMLAKTTVSVTPFSVSPVLVPLVYFSKSRAFSVLPQRG